MYTMFYFVYILMASFASTNKPINAPTYLPPGRGGGGGGRGGEVGGYSMKLLPCHQIEMKYLAPEISSQFNANLPT